MEDNYSPRDYGDETGLLWLCNYLYSEKVEIYGSFELITENYFAIGLSERYGAIKRATTKKCSTLRLLTPAKKILATLFVARQVQTWEIKRTTSLFNTFLLPVLPSLPEDDTKRALQLFLKNIYMDATR